MHVISYLPQSTSDVQLFHKIVPTDHLSAMHRKNVDEGELAVEVFEIWNSKSLRLGVPLEISCMLHTLQYCSFSM